jgi:hypothetical protein
VTCPHCDQAAPFHGYRDRHVLSLLGDIRYGRAYYFCRRCGCGQVPFDQEHGLGNRRLSPAAEQVVCRAGACTESFDRAADHLDEMSGLIVSASTVQRTTEDVGARLADDLQADVTYGAKADWDWHQDASGRKVAYVTLDATGTRQQAADGGKAEGRMAYVGGVYNPSPPEWLRPGQPAGPVQARYVSGLYELAEMGPLLRRQGRAVGMDRAEVWVALTDGGAGLERLLQTHFNRDDLVVILDFYHAASYLSDLARALHPADEAAARTQTEAWCRLLKEEGGATTLAVLREWSWPPRRSAALREAWSALESYFSNNVHRMAYPEYVAEGWQIGSGVVESACKSVVGQRLKGAGMRWSEAGAHRLCHVRALYRSEKGQWQAFWRQQRSARTPVQPLK